MIDFGTAFNLLDNEGYAEKIGTLNYMSPEVLLCKEKQIDYRKPYSSIPDNAN